MVAQVEKLVQMHKETDHQPDDKWTLVKAKGKNKIGESDETVCSQPVEHTSPPDTLGNPIMVEEQRVADTMDSDNPRLLEDVQCLISDPDVKVVTVQEESKETEEALETEEELLASMVVKMNLSRKQAR